MRKILFTLFFLVFLFTGCDKEPDLFLNLTLHIQEHSEDENGQLETLSIEGDDVTYAWTYEGYHPDEDFEHIESFKMELSPEEIEALFVFMEEQDLLTSVIEASEIYPYGEEIELSFELNYLNYDIYSHLSGMLKVWMSNESSPQLLQNQNYIKNLQSLILWIKDLHESK